MNKRQGFHFFNAKTIWKENKYFLHIFLLYPMRSMGEIIGIGHEASSASTGPQAKTTEPMDSIKATYCSIQLG